MVMKIRLPILFLLVGVFLIATVLKFILNALGDNGVAWDDPQFSVSEAQRKGIYVCLAKATPATFQWNGTTISFREIWIENRVHTDHSYIWLTRKNQSGGQYLCFTINASKPIFTVVSSPFFVCDEGDFGGSAGTINLDKLFDVWLKPDALARHSANLRLVKDWKDQNPTSISLTW
jgi:hypothetical protein